MFFYNPYKAEEIKKSEKEREKWLKSLSPERRAKYLREGFLLDVAGYIVMGVLLALLYYNIFY